MKEKTGNEPAVYVGTYYKYNCGSVEKRLDFQCKTACKKKPELKEIRAFED